MAEPLWRQPFWQLADAVRAGELKAVDLLEHYLARIDAANPELNALVFLDREGAWARARRVDEEVAAGRDPGPLAGLPLGVKELHTIKGWPDTAASLVFKDRVGEWDDTVLVRLRDAGAVPLGLTAAPEFGTIAFTRSKLHGTTRSPWNLDRTPGGSSGGTAAAVAAGLVPLATGSDGGGSIRIPSSYSGLVGLKPSWGRVSLGPRVTTSDLTSVLGPMTTTVRDAARFLDAVIGVDVRDRWSLPAPPFRYEDTLDPAPLRGLRAVWSDSLGYGICDPEVAEITRHAAMALIDAAGLVLVQRDVDLPDTALTWGILGSQDLYRSLAAHWPGCADDLTPATRLGMENSDRLNRRRYARAVSARIELGQSLGDLFSEVDLLLTPATATVACPAEGPMYTEIDGRPVSPMGSVCFTYPFNLSGHPGLSIPAGLTADGLPIGLQVVARIHEDHLLLQAAAALEAARPWPRFAPYADGVAP